jgi:predicted secreted protein
VNWFTGFAIYLTIWWTVLFTVLPLGTVTHAEAGIDKGDGGDPGAPVDPKLKQKFITTTWVSSIIFVILFVILHFKLISLPPLPSTLGR